MVYFGTHAKVITGSGLMQVPIFCSHVNVAESEDLGKGIQTVDSSHFSVSNSSVLFIGAPIGYYTDTIFV
jgi:hypothetical protein